MSTLDIASGISRSSLGAWGVFSASRRRPALWPSDARRLVLPCEMGLMLSADGMIDMNVPASVAA